MQPFIIKHSDGRELELSDYAFFLEEYEPQGFAIESPPRFGYWGGPTQPPTVEPEPKLEPELESKTKKTSKD